MRVASYYAELPGVEQDDLAEMPKGATSTLTSTRSLIGAQLLYIAIDLGERPRFDEYVDQVRILGEVQHFLFERCRMLHTQEIGKTVGLPPILKAPKMRAPSGPEKSDDHMDTLWSRDPFSPAHRSLTVVRTSMASPWITVLSSAAENSVPILYGGAVLFGLHNLLSMLMAWQKHQADMRDRERKANVDVAPTTLMLMELLKEHPEQFLQFQFTPKDHEAFGEMGSRLDALKTVLASEMISSDDSRVQGS